MQAVVDANIADIKSWAYVAERVDISMQGNFPKKSYVEDMSEIYKRSNGVYGISPSTLIEQNFFYRY
jgi:hypothetical protein